MRKIFALITLTIVLSCSSSDDDVNFDHNNIFNSPQCIQGTWLYVNNGVMAGGYEFTSNSFISIHGENQLRTNFKDLLEAHIKAGGTPDVNEAISEDEYSFTIDQGINSQSFS